MALGPTAVSANGARRMITTAPVAYRAGLHFDPPRQFLIARSDSEHHLAGVRAVEGLGLDQDLFVGRADEIRLPAIRPLEPFVIATGRNDTSMVRERVPEHGFIGNGLRSRVDEFNGAAGSVPYDLDRVRW